MSARVTPAQTLNAFLEVSRRYLAQAAVRAGDSRPAAAPRRGLVSSRLRAGHSAS